MATTDTIERYISDLEAIKNYDKVKRERDEALKKADPVELLKNIINELSKPHKEQDFPQDLKDSGIVEEIEGLLRNEKERIARVDSWFEKYIRATK